MCGLTYWGPFVLVVVSNVLYHNIAKWTPITLSPMLGLSIIPILINITCAIILIVIGILVYDESLSLKQGIGILCCFDGLYLIR